MWFDVELKEKSGGIVELKLVHEAVIGKRLLASAFRRNISNYVEETADMTIDEGHRPAKLYRKRRIG